MPSAIGTSASTIGCSTFASSDEPASTGSGTGKCTRRDTSWFSASATPVSSGESTQKTPKPVATADSTPMVMPGPERTSAVTAP